MKAKDFWGNEISVGSEVAFMQKGYRSLRKGIILKVTDKTVLIGHEKTNVCSSETKQFHNQVIVKP